MVVAIEAVLVPRVAETYVVVTEPVRERVEAAVKSTVLVDAGAGPLGALQVVARRARSPWILLVGGDHPRPGFEVVEALHAAVTEDRDAVAIRLDGFGQPLWALYRRDAVLNLVDPPRSLFGALQRLSTRWIDGDSMPEAVRAVFEDVDTLEDARRYGLG